MPRYYTDPFMDSKAEWTEVPSGAAYLQLIDAARQPTAPSTSTYIEVSTDNLITRCCYGGEPAWGEGERVLRSRGWVYAETPSANHSIILTGQVFNHELLTIYQASPNTTYNGVGLGWYAMDWWYRRHSNAEAGRLGMQITLDELAAEAGVTRIYASYFEIETEPDPTEWRVAQAPVRLR
jgi:hypothetical protein